MLFVYGSKSYLGVTLSGVVDPSNIPIKLTVGGK